MAVTYSRYKFETVSLFITVTGSRSTLKKSVGTSKKALDIIVFQGGDDGRGYRNMCKIPRGSDLKQGDWYITVAVINS
jgi:hypothetical protein